MSLPEPRVSIGVPVYNGERYLAATLDSLLAQTFDNFEIIVSDNASSDRTAQLALEYAERDSRVRYTRNPRNLGAGANYRRAFQLSRGQYFRWSAADDISAPESLARCVEVLDRQPNVVLAYPKTRFIDTEGRVTSDYDDCLHIQSPRASLRFQQVLERLSLCNALYGLMRANIVRRTRLLNDFLSADVVFQAELSMYGTFWEIPEFLFYRRFHPQASSTMTKEQLLAFYQPQNSHPLWLREWRHIWEHLRSVLRAPLGITDKLLMELYLVRVVIGKSPKLARELVGAGHYVLDGLSRSAHRLTGKPELR